MLMCLVVYHNIRSCSLMTSPDVGVANVYYYNSASFSVVTELKGLSP